MFDDFLDLIKTLGRKLLSSRLAALAVLFSCMFLFPLFLQFPWNGIYPLCKNAQKSYLWNPLEFQLLNLLL